MRRNGFSLILFLIISAFVISPIAFWVALPKSREKESVKGASVHQDMNGTSVTLSSSGGTWDLFKYLCIDRESCLESLISGKKLSTVSGGNIDNHEILIEYTSGWEEYSYLKVYVRTGWGTSGASFSVANLGNVEGSLRELVNYKDSTYEVVLIPTSQLGKSFVKGPLFTNN